MNKLTLIFLLFCTSAIGQVKTPKPSSFSEDKKLGLYIFNKVNEYRNSLGESSYVWSEHWYKTSYKWNTYLSENALYGHRNGSDWDDIGGSELIGGVTLSDSAYYEIDTGLFEFVADSMVNQWIHSPMHHSMLKAPLRTNQKTHSRLDMDEDGRVENFDVPLMKYGAISVNINRYRDYSIVQCIFHLGINEDNNDD